MRNYLYTFLISLFIGNISIAQPLFAAKHKSQEASLKNLKKDEKLQKNIDSVSFYSQFFVYGFYKNVDLTQQDAQQEDIGDFTYFTWKFFHPHLNARIYINTAAISTRDTLYFINQNGVPFDTLHYDKLLGQSYTSEATYGEQYIQFKKHNSSNARVNIIGISEELPSQKGKTADFGDSGDCEVNSNCSEGIPYDNVKNAVVRILVKVGNVLGYCSGTLVNNTLNDKTPYLLTAEHCALENGVGDFLDPNDLNAWVFYFQYRSPDCSNPIVEGLLGQKKITGASFIARSDDHGGETGSDFLLLKLNNSIPSSYNPFYAGWNRAGDNPPQNGACLHHPKGDIQKISQFQGAAQSNSFGTQAQNTHWRVSWTPTPNGYGITEGGSSGAALFDANQLIRGNLTGGQPENCASPQGYDYFGKFSYSWDQNGNTPQRRLKDWLDPTNSGQLAIGGCGTSACDTLQTNTFEINPTYVDIGYFTLINFANQQENVDILVSDISGKVVFHKNTTAIPGIEEVVTVNHLRNGLYFVSIIEASKIKTIKIMVNNY